MGLAEVHAFEPHGVADRPVVAGQFRSRLQIHGCDVVTEGDAERTGIRLVRMVEVPAIIATQYPQLQVAVQGGVSAEELLKLFGHLLQFIISEHAIDAAVEAPDQITGTDALGQEHADPMN